MSDFIIDDRELKKFPDDLKIMRLSQIGAIQRGVVNDQGKATRLNAQREQIPKMFNTRSKWVASSILVDFARKGSKNIRSEVGGKKRWRRNTSKNFMGLLQQEKGLRKNKPDINTIASRGGSFARNVKPSERLNRLGQIIKISNPSSEISILRKKDRENYKGAFYFKQSRRFKKGIYKFTSKKISLGNSRVRQLKMIQDKSRTSIKLRRKPWMANAVKKAVTLTTTARMYRRNFERYTKKRLK